MRSPTAEQAGGLLWQAVNYRYIRVSSVDQNPERQREQLAHAAVERSFLDTVSGKSTQRPELDALLAFVREGDTLVVTSIDRLARNLDDLRRLVQHLTRRGMRIEFLTEHLTFTRKIRDDAVVRVLVRMERKVQLRHDISYC